LRKKRRQTESKTKKAKRLKFTILKISQDVEENKSPHLAHLWKMRMQKIPNSIVKRGTEQRTDRLCRITYRGEKEKKKNQQPHMRISPKGPRKENLEFNFL